MTWTARFKVTEVNKTDESGATEVRAVASVEDGSLTQNTERAKRMELFALIEGETSLSEGDEITGSGHFAG